MESGFNPFPQQSSLSGAKICRADTSSCPGFSLSGPYLRVFNRTDIISQQVSFNISSTEASPMASIAVYVDNVSLGTVEGPFAPNTPKSVALAVPTTIDVLPGTTYSIVVEGVFAASSGSPSTDYWQSVSVVAVAG